eukprot:1147439-Pelagomonas_calceolata.AAC.10
MDAGMQHPLFGERDLPPLVFMGAKAGRAHVKLCVALQGFFLVSSSTIQLLSLPAGRELMVICENGGSIEAKAGNDKGFQSREGDSGVSVFQPWARHKISCGVHIPESHLLPFTRRSEQQQDQPCLWRLEQVLVTFRHVLVLLASTCVSSSCSLSKQNFNADFTTLMHLRQIHPCDHEQGIATYAVSNNILKV